MQRVVIVGAGFAGLSAALRLDALLKHRPDVEIVLIDEHNRHNYTPLLYEVATAFFKQESTAGDAHLRSAASMTLDHEHILSGTAIKFVQCTVERIDREKRAVICSDGTARPYDFLVLALGSTVNYFSVPGLKEHAFHLKNVYDAAVLRRRLYDLVKQHRAGHHARCDVVIGGGGATGVETAAELANLFGHVVRHGALGKNDYAITLIEATDRLLSGLNARLSVWALSRLKKLGVTVRLQTIITRVSEQGIEFKTPDGADRISSCTLIWAGGIKGHPLIAAAGFTVEEKGRAMVEPTLLVKGEDRVYAIGDCANFRVSADAPLVPALAQIAIQEGKVVAESIFNVLHGRLPCRFDRPHWTSIVPLGGKYALGTIGGWTIAGPHVWFLHKLADLRYFLSILSWREAWSLWLAGLKAYAQND